MTEERHDLNTRKVLVRVQILNKLDVSCPRQKMLVIRSEVSLKTRYQIGGADGVSGRTVQVQYCSAKRFTWKEKVVLS